MALYDNKYWLLSHIRHSFISSDDTGLCEMIMAGEDIKHLKAEYDKYPNPDSSESSEDDSPLESSDYGYGMDFGIRARTNTAARIEKIEQAKRRAARVTLVKWEQAKPKKGGSSDKDDAKEEMFVRKVGKEKPKTEPAKSLLSEQLEKALTLPQNPFLIYAKFDSTGQMNVPVKRYRIFLSVPVGESKIKSIPISCVGSARVQELIGLILFKISNMDCNMELKPPSHYGLYITEEDGEIDRDLPCLDAADCVSKYGFTCLGLVEHDDPSKFTNLGSPNVEFTERTPGLISIRRTAKEISKTEENRQISSDLELMAVHKKAMDAPLYQSFKVCIVNRVRARIEINLGVGGDKLEINPIQNQSSKFTIYRQKPMSHSIDSIACCEITDTKHHKSTFKVIYSPSFEKSSASTSKATASSFSLLQSSASYKYYDFEADEATAKDVVEKINLILELKSSFSKKEYVAARERKQYKRRSFHIAK